MMRIAIAGLGHVGAAVLSQLTKNRELITRRAGCEISVTAVSARDHSKVRSCSLDGVRWVDDPRLLSEMDDVDGVVELIGGSEGVAHDLALSSLNRGRHFITANKALLAAHGPALARLAKEKNVQISYEAAVAGGIPIIKTLREALAGDRIHLVQGILNGTCNFILGRMRKDGLTFPEALSQAQQLGYTERDPTADIDGFDTADKLALLAALAFGTEPSLHAIEREGIRHITPLDLRFAEELGYCVKLLGVARATLGGFDLRVGPSLVPLNSPLSSLDGPLNAIRIQSEALGDLILEGAGAGGQATANAVISDIIDLARGNRVQMFSFPPERLKKFVSSKISTSRFYIRLEVLDQSGVVAEITSILRDERISIQSLLQHGQSQTSAVPLVITTHQADRLALIRAVQKMTSVRTVTKKPCLMQIEE